MYIVVIAWLFVVVLMAVVEATSSVGTVLGAVVTFVLYGVLPLSIVIFIMGTPGRRRRLHARQLQERAEWEASQASAANLSGAPTVKPADAREASNSAEPDAGSHAAGAGNTQPIGAADAGPVPAVRKEP